MAQKNVRLDPLIENRPKELKAVLKADFGLSATQEEIVAALIHGTTPAQLAGMLVAFNRHAAEAAAKVGQPAVGTQGPDSA